MSGIIGGDVRSRSGIIGLAGDIQVESILGADRFIGDVTGNHSVWLDSILISDLDAGYWYFGDSHLHAFDWHAVYSAAYFFSTSSSVIAINYISQGTGYFVQRTATHLQVKETASGATGVRHVTYVRKLFKNV